MESAVIVYLITYAALGVFGLAVGLRFIRITRMPMHLRWELYPVAHEAGEKAKYGGSQLEELDWWTKPKHTSLINELKYMIPEMTFLVALFEHNRKMWWRSFPFHFGLYILAGMCGLLGLGAIMELADMYVGPAGGASSLGPGVAVYYLTQVAALTGLALSTLGAAGLLQLRLFDPELKNYASLGHIFNLLCFLGVYAVAWLTFIFVDTDFAATRSFIQALITFKVGTALGTGMSAASSGLLALEIVLAVLLIAYIPLTHMSHFFVKWFTYHKVRWDDTANEVGSEIERKVIEQVQYPVTWSGAHLNADGKKNWVDIATEEMK
jgi:nitrate reductase gamma subunit